MNANDRVEGAAKSSAPSVQVMPTRTAVLLMAGSGIVAAVLVTAIQAARANQGGPSTANLAFAGTLLDSNGKPVPGKPTLTFSFKKAGVLVCAPKATPIDPIDATTGAFRALIPLDAAGTACPSSLFDGSDVTIDIQVGNSVVATGQPIGAVPYAKFADQVGTTDCPVGYAKAAAPAFLPEATVCQKGNDEVVKVGTGPSAFWIDRYEASVWQNADGSGNRYFKDGDNESGVSLTFPKNGQYTVPAYAASKKGELPSRYLTWFQASMACRVSGKRLPSGEEWLAAGRRTFDPVAGNPGAGLSPTTNAMCNTTSTGPRPTGSALAGSTDTSCVSSWGAEDLIGNLWEWTNEWYAGLGDTSQSAQPWPDNSYGGDGTWNIASSASNGLKTLPGLPSAALRGGSWGGGTTAGLFALDLLRGPSYWDYSIGFRCVLAR